MDELKEVLGADLDDDVFKEIIAAADADGDGEISYPEFAQMMLKLYKK